MMKLRLKRFGKKREPSYRIVAIESCTRRQAQPLAELGFYNPRTKETVLKTAPILYWLQKGAQPTDTLKAIFQKAGLFDMLAVGKTTDTPDVLKIPAIAKVSALVEEEPVAAPIEEETVTEAAVMPEVATDEAESVPPAAGSEPLAEDDVTQSSSEDPSSEDRSEEPKAESADDPSLPLETSPTATISSEPAN